MPTLTQAHPHKHTHTSPHKHIHTSTPTQAHKKAHAYAQEHRLTRTRTWCTGYLFTVAFYSLWTTRWRRVPTGVSITRGSVTAMAPRPPAAAAAASLLRRRPRLARVCVFGHMCGCARHVCVAMSVTYMVRARQQQQQQACSGADLSRQGYVYLALNVLVCYF